MPKTRPLRALPELEPAQFYTVPPSIAAIVIEAGRNLGAPIRKDARSQAAFEEALARLIGLAHAEMHLRLYQPDLPPA